MKGAQELKADTAQKMKTIELTEEGSWHLLKKKAGFLGGRAQAHTNACACMANVHAHAHASQC